MSRQPPRTHLFVLRLWLEDLGGGQQEWRGHIQHVRNREMQYFRDLKLLLEFVQAQLQNAQDDDSRKIEQQV
jgi:hypothetical protein